MIGWGTCFASYPIQCNDYIDSTREMLYTYLHSHFITNIIRTSVVYIILSGASAIFRNDSVGIVLLNLAMYKSSLWPVILAQWSSRYHVGYKPYYILGEDLLPSIRLTYISYNSLLTPT